VCQGPDWRSALPKSCKAMQAPRLGSWRSAAAVARGTPWCSASCGDGTTLCCSPLRGKRVTEECCRVLPGDLFDLLVAELAGHPRLDEVLRVGPRGRRMRVVDFEHDVVLADPLDQRQG